jgi:hypothetical protein
MNPLLNKNSFFFYVMKTTGGRHDPAHLKEMIELLKEWLPHSAGYPDNEYSMDAYEYGQREYKQFLMENLK